MKVEFAPSFFKSMKKAGRQKTWWYRIYDLFRYRLPWFFRNIRHFRKELWKFRPWDWQYNISLLGESLRRTKEGILLGFHEGKEEDAEKIQRAVDIIDRTSGDKWIEIAEEKIGRKTNTNYLFDKEPSNITQENSEIFKLAQEIEEKEWSELFDLLRDRMKYWWS